MQNSWNSETCTSPYVYSLSRHFRITVPPWFFASSRKDNWQMSAWPAPRTRGVLANLNRGISEIASRRVKQDSPVLGARPVMFDGPMAARNDRRGPSKQVIAACGRPAARVALRGERFRAGYMDRAKLNSGSMSSTILAMMCAAVPLYKEFVLRKTAFSNGNESCLRSVLSPLEWRSHMRSSRIFPYTNSSLPLLQE